MISGFKRSEYRLIWVDYILTRKCTEDPSFWNALQVVRFFVSSFISQVVWCRIGIVEYNKGARRGNMRAENAIPTFLTTWIYTKDTFFIPSFLSCFLTIYFSTSRQISHCFDHGKVDRFRCKDCNLFSSFRNSCNLLRPVYIWIRN